MEGFLGLVDFETVVAAGLEFVGGGASAKIGVVVGSVDFSVASMVIAGTEMELVIFVD